MPKRKFTLMYKLLISFLAVSLLPLIFIFFLTEKNMEQALLDHDFSAIAAVSELKKSELEYSFAGFEKNIKTLSAMSYLKDAFYDLEIAKNGAAERNFSGRKLLEDSGYKKVFDKYYSSLKEFAAVYGFYDIFLFAPDQGDILLTVALENDFGTRLDTAKTHLATAWQSMKRTGKTVFSDFAIYPISNNEPAMFLISPVFDHNRYIGAIGLQLPDKIMDAIIHKNDGLGKSGESYLVGSDFRMRSNSFHKAATHTVKQSFLGTIRQNGLKIEPVELALSGKTGRMIAKNLNGQPALTVYTPFKLAQNNWALVTQIDLDEIRSPVVYLGYQILIAALIVFFLIVLFSYKLAKSFSLPLSELNEAAKSIAAGDFSQDLSIKSRDEIGELANSFLLMKSTINEMIFQASELLNQSLQGDFTSSVSAGDFQGTYHKILLTIKEHNELARAMKETLHLTALSGLTAGIAHEINQPLTALKVTADSLIFLEESGQAADRKTVIEKIGFIALQAERIKQIISHMRSLVIKNSDANYCQEADLNLAVENSLDLLNEQITNHKIILNKKLESKPILIKSSLTQAEQIIINLLTNSVKALSNLAISEKTITITTEIEESCAILTIKDNGKGIAEEIQSRLFEPFVTTGNENNMGLGLFIVKNIVSQLNGSIEYTTDDGACFKLRFLLGDKSA